MRSDNLAAHVKSKHTTAPVRNTVVLEESDDALLEAAADFVQAMAAKQASKKAEKEVTTVHTLREQFPIEVFEEEKKAICARIVRASHKDTFGTEECSERCARLRPEIRCDCPGFTPPWSRLNYGRNGVFEAMYEAWLKKKAGVA